MFSSIIWATDGSEHADRALPFLEQLAKTFAASILVVHVDQRLGGRATGYPVLADEPELQTKIEEQTAHLVELGMRLEEIRLDVQINRPAQPLRPG